MINLMNYDFIMDNIKVNICIRGIRIGRILFLNIVDKILSLVVLYFCKF